MKPIASGRSSLAASRDLGRHRLGRRSASWPTSPPSGSVAASSSPVKPMMLTSGERRSWLDDIGEALDLLVGPRRSAVRIATVRSSVSFAVARRSLAPCSSPRAWRSASTWRRSPYETQRREQHDAGQADAVGDDEPAPAIADRLLVPGQAELLEPGEGGGVLAGWRPSASCRDRSAAPRWRPRDRRWR